MQPGFFVVILTRKAQRIFDGGGQEINLTEGLIVSLLDDLLGGVGEQMQSAQVIGVNVVQRRRARNRHTGKAYGIGYDVTIGLIGQGQTTLGIEREGAE